MPPAMPDEPNQKIFEQDFESLMNQFYAFSEKHGIEGILIIKRQNDELPQILIPTKNDGTTIYQASKLICKCKDMIVQSLLEDVQSGK